MRKLALDIGSKQIGIAVSDPSNTLAQPLKTIIRSDIDKEAKEIKSLIKSHDVSEIIAGMPIDLKGQRGVAAQNMEDYIVGLEKALGIKIKRVDERLTTKIAEDILKSAGLNKKKRKAVVDELAATIILQNVLEHEKTKH